MRIFLEEYVKDRNCRAAARRAGFGAKWAKTASYGFLADNKPYVVWYEALLAQASAKRIAIELEPVLEEIAKIAFANEHDYLVTEWKKGKAVVRRKRLEELTREQMVAIKVKRVDGVLDYDLRDKEGRLVDLGKHLGAFNEKLILEHRHAHLHAHLDLTGMPIKQLEALEAEFEKHFKMVEAQ